MKLFALALHCRPIKQMTLDVFAVIYLAFIISQNYCGHSLIKGRVYPIKSLLISTNIYKYVLDYF